MAGGGKNERISGPATEACRRALELVKVAGASRALVARPMPSKRNAPAVDFCGPRSLRELRVAPPAKSSAKHTNVTDANVSARNGSQRQFTSRRKQFTADTERVECGVRRCDNFVLRSLGSLAHPR